MDAHLKDDFKCASTDSLISLLEKLNAESLKCACIELARHAWYSDYKVLSKICDRSCELMFKKEENTKNDGQEIIGLA